MKYDTLRMLTEAKLHKSMSFGGMNISIEVPADGYRTGKNRDGVEWKHKIGAHYGYIKGTHSPDGEHLDCYVRKNPKRDAKIYVVHQLTVDGSRFDEDKVMLGFASAAEARRMFKACTFKPTIMYGGMSEFTLEHFRLAAYSASRSKAMLTDEETFADFKKRGLMPRGIKSPLGVALRVSESVTEGTTEFQGLLADSLQDLGTALAEGDVRHCLEFAGYEGRVPRNEKSLNQLIGEAFQYFMESGIQNSNYLDDDEFRQRALMIITNEDSFMTDITNDIMAEDDTYGYEKMPQLHFEDSRDCERVAKFCDEQFIRVSRDMNTIYFETAEQYQKYQDMVELLGDPVTSDEAFLPDDPKAREPSWHGESYTVMVSTQLMENVGSEFAPMWSHSTGRYIPVQTGLQSYGAARKIVAEVSAGLIPVELSKKESVIGIEIVTDGEYRQFYEAETAEEKVEEDTTDDVFFAQQVQELKERSGIEEDVTPVRSSPSIHDLKARLAAIQEEFDAARAKELLESPFQASLGDFAKAMRLVGKTMIKNPRASSMGCVKAVAKDILGDVDLAEELKGYIESQLDMGLDAYAEHARSTGEVEENRMNESEGSWTVIQKGVPDVTGDDAQAAMDEYGTTDLVQREPADPSDEFSRDVLTYMNPERNVKVVMRPSYDGSNGEYYVITVYRRDDNLEEDRVDELWLATSAGGRAFSEGEPRSANPHPPGSSMAVNWNMAWDNAQDKHNRENYKRK